MMHWKRIFYFDFWRFSRNRIKDRPIDSMEFANKVDNVPEDQKPAVLCPISFALRTFDVWKDMDEKDQNDAEKIKTALRGVIGLIELDAWMGKP